MKRLLYVPAQRRVLFLAVAVLSALPFCPIYAEEATVALLMQQTPAEAGAVIPSTGVYHFEPHAAITLSAVPKRGYQFVYWLGEVEDPSSSVTTAYLDKPKIVVAVFEQVNFDRSASGNRSPSGLRASAGGGFRSSGLRTSSVSIGTAGASVASPSGGSTEGDSPTVPNPPIIIDPPQPPIPEPATVVLLGLGSLALLRNRKGR